MIRRRKKRFNPTFPRSDLRQRIPQSKRVACCHGTSLFRHTWASGCHFHRFPSQKGKRYFKSCGTRSVGMEVVYIQRIHFVPENLFSAAHEWTQVLRERPRTDMRLSRLRRQPSTTTTFYPQTRKHVLGFPNARLDERARIEAEPSGSFTSNSIVVFTG